MVIIHYFVGWYGFDSSGYPRLPFSSFITICCIFIHLFPSLFNVNFDRIVSWFIIHHPSSGLLVASGSHFFVIYISGAKLKAVWANNISYTMQVMWVNHLIIWKVLCYHGEMDPWMAGEHAHSSPSPRYSKDAIGVLLLST